MFFFKQKTAYEMRISDCSSDVCSSDLELPLRSPAFGPVAELLLGPVDHFFLALLLRRDHLLVDLQVDLVLFVVQLQLYVVLRHGRMLRSRMPATPAATTGQLELSLRVKQNVRASCRERVFKFVYISGVA